MKTTMSQGETVSHTPGPWSISGVPGDNYVMARDGRNRVSVCQLMGWPGITPEELEANKGLIAAAPDLLEACKVVSEMFDDSMFVWGSDDEAKVSNMLKHTRAAIDRATTQKEGAK